MPVRETSTLKQGGQELKATLGSMARPCLTVNKQEEALELYQ